MAQRTMVILEDDIEGGDAEESITFGLDGTIYEIDLNKKNANRLRKALAEFVENGRKVAKSQVNGRPLKSVKSTPTRIDEGPSSAEIRDWARTAGIEVNPTGRIAQDVRDAFDAAKNKGKDKNTA